MEFSFLNGGELVMFMQFFSLYDLFYQWENAGVFDLLLPALLIFAVIFGVLTTTRILGENRGVNTLIAGIIAILAVRTEVVPYFFAEIFPSLGVALAVIISAMILVGLFVAKGHNLGTFLSMFFYIGLTAGAVLLLVTLNRFDWFGSFWWQQNWVNILIIAIIVGIVAMFVNSGKRNQKEKDEISGGGKITFPLEALRK